MEDFHNLITLRHAVAVRDLQKRVDLGVACSKNVSVLMQPHQSLFVRFSPTMIPRHATATFQGSLEAAVRVSGQRFVNATVGARGPGATAGGTGSILVAVGS